jgi:hypothetical protein
MNQAGGWSLEALQRDFKSQLGAKLEPLGIQKKPYPYYDGIKAPGK